MTVKYQIVEDKSGEWRWRIVAANSEITGVSGESFTRKADAVRALKSFVESIRGSSSFVIVTIRRGQQSV
jgi:hypothetical protein